MMFVAVEIFLFNYVPVLWGEVSDNSKDISHFYCASITIPIAKLD